jgi:hypothetical protein
MNPDLGFPWVAAKWLQFMRIYFGKIEMRPR